MTFPAKFPQLNETQLTEHARTVLIRVIRVAFPHSRIPDGPYERTADIILKEAQASTWFRVALTQGLNSLDGLAGGDFCALDDDEEVWTVLGYEGPSFDKGGYLHRGFDDLDWLPEPRIEEYDGPETFEPIWRGPGAAAGNGASTPTPDSGENQGKLAATLSTQQDPREGARPADQNPAKASV